MDVILPRPVLKILAEGADQAEGAYLTLLANASSVTALIVAADEAMYEAKRAGRDRLTVSGRRCQPEPAARRGSL